MARTGPPRGSPIVETPSARDIDPAALAHGETWAIGPDGMRMWGAFGAAGLLAHDRSRGVLLQHRAPWSHHGDTWGIPGGAVAAGETAVEGALREAHEETRIEPDALEPLFTRVRDLGFWRYTTLAGVVVRDVEARATDAESVDVRWVAVDEVEALPLHPYFGEDWPDLRGLLAAGRPIVVVDAANVVGSRADGWWRDRAGAAERLLAAAERAGEEGVPAPLLGLDAERAWPDLVVVLEGRALDAPAAAEDAAHGVRVRVERADGSGDDAIAARVARLAAEEAGRPLAVVTSDRGLRERVARAAPGARVIGSGAFRSMLDAMTPDGE